jgi:hypothetical protein
MNADPRAFGRLLCLLADRHIVLRFEGTRLIWRAPPDAMDREVLRLVRRFKTALRQAFGPDLLEKIEADSDQETE